MTLTWQVLSQAGDPIWSISKVAPPWTWWPSLYPDICKLAFGAPANWDMEGYSDPDMKAPNVPSPPGRYGLDPWGGCGHPSRRSQLRTLPFYICPGFHRAVALNPTCGGGSYFFCKNWGCETSGNTYWNPTSSWDYITVTANYSRHETGSQGWTYKPECENWCLPLKISFTEPGKNQRGWTNGYTWGLRLYKERFDDGLFLRIRLKVTSIPPVAIGPDHVIVEQGPPKEPLPSPSKKVLPSPLPPSIIEVVPAEEGVPTALQTTFPTTLSPTTGDRLFSLIQGAFSVLNVTNPEATESCWLCLAMAPPYYEGIAVLGQIIYTSDHTQCRWGTQSKLTLTEVSGSGICLGRVPPTHQHLCNQTLPVNTAQDTQYLLPSNDSWWACSTGLSPCVSTSVFNQSKDFCVMVQLVPRIYYHPEETLLQAYDNSPSRIKREPVSLTLAVMLGLGLAAGVGTGSAALIKGPIDLKHGLDNLRAAMDTDLRALQDSVSKLEDSLTSLSEVVLQNRRGLDLLFLKEGGLCAALKEECCFYVDHSGAIRDSMKKLKERLDKRQLERQNNQNWYESWFSKSPWMTTLFSALMGPLLILLLLLTIGPYIINRLIAFIHQRVSAIQVLVLRQQYQRLQSDQLEPDEVETNI